MWETSNAVALFVYVLAIGFLFLFGVVVVKMMSNTINLANLVSEADGKASLSRFQLLVFTFVTAGLFLILSVEAGQILDIPNGVLALLGISGGSYLVSKGIQDAKGTRETKGKDKKE
jgi:hypothetical protein